MEGVQRIEIPTPFAIGTVSCYVSCEDSLALLEPGPMTTDTVETVIELPESFADYQEPVTVTDEL